MSSVGLHERWGRCASGIACWVQHAACIERYDVVAGQLLLSSGNWHSALPCLQCNRDWALPNYNWRVTKHRAHLRHAWEVAPQHAGDHDEHASCDDLRLSLPSEWPHRHRQGLLNYLAVQLALAFGVCEEDPPQASAKRETHALCETQQQQGTMWLHTRAICTEVLFVSLTISCDAVSLLFLITVGLYASQFVVVHAYLADPALRVCRLQEVHDSKCWC